jgi:hypothetical protein
MKRSIESDYTSLVSYTRALEEYCDTLSRVEQEPVAWMDVDGNVSDNNDHKCFPIPLYTTPPTAQPEQPAQQKAVAIEHCLWARNGNTPCPHTTPPEAQRKPLTDEQIETIWKRVQANDFHDCVQPFARAIEAKLKELNCD